MKTLEIIINIVQAAVSIATLVVVIRILKERKD